MKKSAFFLMLAFGLFLAYMPAKAQVITGKTAQASVTTTVQTALTLTKSQDVKFGAISATSSPVLDPKGVSTSTDVGSTAQVGVFDITGANSANVIVNYDANVTLSDGTPADDITFTPNVIGDKLSTNQSSASTIINGAAVALDGTAGTFTLWVGGNLGTLSGQATGNYTGTLNVNVYYQ